MEKKDYLVCVAPTYGSAAFDELDSLLVAEGIRNPRDIYSRGNHDQINFRLDQNIHNDPFVIFRNLSNAVALRVYHQSVMIRHMWELWCSSTSFHGCLHGIQHIQQEYKDRYFKDTQATWRMDIHSFGQQIRNRDHEQMRKHFGTLYTPEGTVNLRNPSVTYAFIVDHQPTHAHHHIDNPRTVHGTVNPETIVYCPPVPDIRNFTIYSTIPSTPVTSSSSSLSSSSLSSSSSSSCVCGFHIDTELCAPIDHLCNPHLHHPLPDPSLPPSTASLATFSSSLFRRIFFGVSLPLDSNRKYLSTLKLSTRPYLGPTSLDPELALLMSNLGHSRRGRIVWDPFAGTGSITVAAEKLGAITLGSDIDPRVQSGKLGRNVATNFSFYGLGFPEQIRMDNSNVPLRQSTHGIIDSIVTDPPYGVRAGARKLGKSEKKKARKSTVPSFVTITNNHNNDHVDDTDHHSDSEDDDIDDNEAEDIVSSSANLPNAVGTFSTKVYDADDVMTDLLDVAAQVLVMNGRLVFIFPATTEDIDPINMIPHHPCLRVVHIAAQGLSFALIRLIVTVEKYRTYDFTKTEEYKQAVRASAEANGLSGGGVRARMGALLDAWFAEQQQLKTNHSATNPSETKESTVAVSLSSSSSTTVSTGDNNVPVITMLPNSSSTKLSKREARLMAKRVFRQEKRASKLEARIQKEKERNEQQQQQKSTEGTTETPNYGLSLSKRELKLLENARRIEALQQQALASSSSSSTTALDGSLVLPGTEESLSNSKKVRISSVPFDAPPWVIKNIEAKLQRIQQHQQQQQQQQQQSNHEPNGNVTTE